MFHGDAVEILEMNPLTTYEETRQGFERRVRDIISFLGGEACWIQGEDGANLFHCIEDKQGKFLW